MSAPALPQSYSPLQAESIHECWLQIRFNTLTQGEAHEVGLKAWLRAVVLDQKWFCPPLPSRGHLQCLEIFLVITTRGYDTIIYGSSPGMLLNILQYTGQLSTTKNYLVQNVNSAKIEKPCLIDRQHWAWHPGVPNVVTWTWKVSGPCLPHL